MIRIFVPPEELDKKREIKLADDKAHYLSSVVRCKVGDVVEAIDGKGNAYKAAISGISQKDVFVDITSEVALDAESALNIAICQGILKGEKMDMVIQKTTELGVKEIFPIITERCIVKETKKTKRWRKIAEEAAEQCGRTVVPTVHEPLEFSPWLMAHGTKQMKGFIFWEEGGISLKEAVIKIFPSPTHQLTNSPIHLFIGPEGGLTANEVDMAEKNGLIRTSLGKSILRAETAAIVSVAMVKFLLE